MNNIEPYLPNCCQNNIKHKTKGYHYLSNLNHNKTGWGFSDNFAHKFCELAGIYSVTKRGRKTAEKENIKFPNTIKENWNTRKPLNCGIRYDLHYA